jgi:hypothetical protein
LKSWLRANAFLLIGCLLGILLIVPRLLFPLQMDQYFHHYLGWRLAEGQLPYLGSYDQNFPGGAILHALCILIFGSSSLGFAVFDLILQSIGIYFIARTAQKLGGQHAAIFAPVIYALTYIGLGVWNTGQRDGFIVPFLAFSAWQLVQDHVTNKRSILLGLACGYMILLRPVLIIFALFAAIYVWSRDRKVSSLLRVLVFGALPALLVICFYSVIGEFTTLYDSIVRFNLEVYGKFRHGVTMRGSGTMTPVFVWGLIGLVLSYRANWQKWKPLTPILVATVIAPFSTWIQGQGDAHHMTPSYAMVGIWASVGIVGLVDVIKLRSVGMRGIAVAVIVLLMVIQAHDRLPWSSINAFAEGRSLRSIYAGSKSGDVHLAEEITVADYLRPRMQPDDYLYIWSMRIWPYQLIGHPSPTRFQSHEHVLMQPKGQPLTEQQLQWRAEMMRDFVAKPPRYILWTTTDHLWLLPNAESSKDLVKRFPEFEQFVKQSYTLDTVIGAFEIYKIRS